MNTIQWALAAQDDYLTMLKDVYGRSVDAAIQIDEKMEALLEKLRRFKHLCPPSRKFPKFRRCVVTRHISLVYEVGSESITILSVFDSRSEHPFA